MTRPTPAVEADLIAKITALLPAEFPAARVFSDAEESVGAAVDEHATFVKFSDQVADDYDGNGAVRVRTYQVKHRFDRTPDRKGAAALARMAKLYDTLHKLGPWTGTSGTDYIDIEARTFPRLLEETYVVMDVSVWLDTAAT